jgi:putative membrane protein
MLSAADHDRIHDAIAAVEARTSGEVTCVVAQESSRYREVPLAWAAAVALVAPPLALALGVRPFAVIALAENGWTAADVGSTQVAVMTALVGYALVQAVLFALVGALVSIGPVRRALTPGFVSRGHVHARAMEQFAHRLHRSKAATGVLIYASLAERRVEVIADVAIHKKVGEVVWRQAVAAAVGPIRHGDVAGGLVAAVQVCGEALARHFPDDGAPPRDEELVSEV